MALGSTPLKTRSLLVTAPQASEDCTVAKECGGCPMIGLPELVQRDSKCALVTEALIRAGVQFPEPRWVLGGARMGYRNRLRLRIDSDGSLGFFNRGKANDCSVLEPELQSLIQRLRQFASSRCHEMSRFAHVELRAPDADARAGACYAPRDGLPVPQATLRSLHDLGTDVLVSVKGALPPEAVPRQRRVLSEDVFCYVPLDAFMQVNTSVNRSLCATVRALAVSHRVVSAIDLYAGSGNLTLPLLREGVLAAAVESQASAIHALRLAAEAQGFEGFEIFAGDARAEAEALAGRGRRWDLVVVDAPRAGVREGLSNMARLASRYMALVSCNPGTLARDLSILEGCGFGVRELYLFDMFAQTRHVEVLAWLSRK